jgi:hypothetical protein
MLSDSLTPKNLVFAIADDYSDIGAISVTIDHVNHPVVTRCFDSSTTAPEMKDGALQQ